MKINRCNLLLLVAVLLMLSPLSWGADPIKGKSIYARHCQNCHGAKGQGQIPGMVNFSRGEGLLKPDTELLETISLGRGIMPGFKGAMTEQEILDVISYLRTLI